MDFATALIAETAAFADLLRDADLSTPVPTCPEWTLEQLMRHVGRGDRWCAQIVAEQSMDFIDPRTVADGKPPAGRDNEIAWLNAGAQQLIDAVAATGADTPVWTFLGPRPAEWWIRRRLHEVVVHRADAAIALGSHFDVDPAIAADAITEWLERVVIQADEEGPAGGDRPLGDGQSLHLHATDPGLGEAGEWTILGRLDGIALDHEHGKATAALRGPARSLLLAVVRRRTAAQEGLEVFGAPEVWDTWLARTPF
ncbi:maleylpyruvate isomerase N-terminal domain-containing protein [Mycobacterium sp. CVI_P3]|uniref:Maleylpyruvate isomerase N-terminal domain-containing protein n=1 Tax=Mycobacterium pinniadriaticum TaxID=2994102 RepID=A0ABT3SLI2_9MYCO|nr:maleylpyruvate isomerase N-terminal domain-containing protein [Mycobacterium pinniadriaticum]MCX2933849.1 maleylpyruvate isomerase N-terminal domain-containing protein [Mycobacterium pinniadriaticum]MCX2940298.1 maleylpyruvate isomerase N-terminal domain-containing protein [Mycobacterium pinniadriaticum]